MKILIALYPAEIHSESLHHLIFHMSLKNLSRVGQFSISISARSLRRFSKVSEKNASLPAWIVRTYTFSRHLCRSQATIPVPRAAAMYTRKPILNLGLLGHSDHRFTRRRTCRVIELLNSLEHSSPWRNWLARSTVISPEKGLVHREVGSSSLPGEAPFFYFFFFSLLLGFIYFVHSRLGEAGRHFGRVLGLAAE